MEFVKKLRMSLTVNKEVFSEVAKMNKLTMVEDVFTDLSFKQFLSSITAIFIMRKFEEKGNKISWEHAVCIANKLSEILDVKDYGMLEIMYYNGLISPEIPFSIEFVVVVNTPLIKDKFKMVVIESLLKHIKTNCKVNEFTENTIKSILMEIVS